MEISGKLTKSLIILLMIFLLAVSPVFSQKIINELQNTANGLIDSLAEALPLNSTVGLNWSDAFIGQFPPHFGLGVSAGITNMKFSAITDLMSNFGIDIDSPNIDIGFPLPAYAVEARLGGIIIPLDVGLKFGYLKPDFMQSILEKFSTGIDFGIEYMLFGVDFRYALLDKKVFPLKLSVGFGVNYLKGGINSAFSDSLEFIDPANTIKLTQESPQFNVHWNTLNFELKPQISFPLKILTPYAGAGLSYSFTEAGYKVTTPELKMNGSPLTDKDIEDLKTRFEFTEISTEGFGYAKKLSKFNVRAFGGFSVNLIFVRLDFTGMYNLLSGDVGATLGFRFQL